MSDIVLDVSPASLARANEANFAEGFAVCARAYGGEVVDAPDLLWCAAGIPSAGWNRVLRARLAPETLDARIEWVKERARALGTPFLWHLIPSTRPVDLDTHLLRHGFTDVGEEPAMGVALARLPIALPLPEGVTIERVRDRSGLEQWARTANAGFGGTAATEAPFVAAASHDALDDAAAAEYYLALLDGEPVASSALTLAAGVAGIFSVATLERARGRGIGAAVTMAPLLAARDVAMRSACCRLVRWAMRSMPAWDSPNSSATAASTGSRHNTLARHPHRLFDIAWSASCPKSSASPYEARSSPRSAPRSRLESLRQISYKWGSSE